MQRRFMRSMFSVMVLLLVLSVAARAETPAKPFTPEALAFYEKEVLPILKANCYKCHADGKLKANFSLLTRASILKGGDRPGGILGSRGK